MVAYHAYYPFGEEATAFNQDTEQMKFTGHERDLANQAGAGDDLDYMHARHCSPLTGRFLSVDPKHTAIKGAPQSWNKYGYGGNAPTKFVDPDGKELRLGMGSHAQTLAATRRMLPPSLRASVGIGTNKSGQAIITVDNSARTNDSLFKNLQRVVNSPGIVSLNVVSPTTPVIMTLANGTQFTAPLQAINNNGITLPSTGTAVGNEPAFSPVKGETQIFVSSAINNISQAATVAAELGAHALPALLGQGAAPASPADHTQREAPLVNAAIFNAQIP